MVIANETIAQPENPPKRWGVEVRPRTLKDYRNVAIASLIFLIFVSLALIPSLPGGTYTAEDGIAFWVLSGFAGVVLMVTLGDPGRVNEEADALASKRAYAWQQEVLFPFLEKKYGIEIPEQRLDSWGWNRAYKGKRSLEFNPHGIVLEYDTFDTSSDRLNGGFYNITLNDDVWIEEVIRPDRVTFRAMEEA